MTANRGLGMAYALSVRASPEKFCDKFCKKINQDLLKIGLSFIDNLL